MAEISVTRHQQPTTSSGAMQVKEPWWQSGLARRGSFFPSIFSLSPSEFFSLSPFELMRRFTEEMDRVFENFGFARSLSTGEPGVWSPAVEVFERDNNLIVRAELPGLNKDDIRVEVTEDGLILQGERKREHEESREGYYRSERSYGRFYRFIPLPEGAQLEQARAQFDNGVLEVSIGIPESQRKRRSIPIETASDQSSQASAKTA